MLFRSIKFSPVDTKIIPSPFDIQEKYIIKNSNLYYSNAIENSSLTAVQKSTPILKKIAAFTIHNSNIIWLGTDGLLYNSDLENLSTTPVKITLTAIKINAVKISPDGKNIIYYNDNNIYLSPLPNVPAEKNILYKTTDKITNCIWLNNDYIIFSAGNKIIISEIDYRGNINAVTLSQTADKIFFDQQSGKLYILTNKTLLLSEKLIP